MEKQNFNISKSFLNSYLEYCNGKACGIKWEAEYISKTLKSEPSEAMLLGRYFEFIATGYYDPRDGGPEPKRTQKGELTAEYKRAYAQGENFKMYAEALGIEILEVGKRIEKDGCSLVLDIVALYKGREVVIDLKYTGKLYDKWDDNGWALEAFEYKTAHHIQPIHYAYMTGMPFYYFVFSSTNEVDCEFFEVLMEQPLQSELHAQTIEQVRKRIDMEVSTGGFIARPSLKRCMACGIAGKCKYAAHAPEEKQVYIQPSIPNIYEA